MKKNKLWCYTRFRGVTAARHGRWKAQISFKDKMIHIGHYLTEEDAAIAYNEKAKELFRDFAYQNKV